jgi:hypothetical protein
MNSARLLLLATATGLCLVLLPSSCDSATEPDTPPAVPEATVDQVGLPTDYATTFRPFYVFDRPDTRQVRVVYANDTPMPVFHFSTGPCW